ncbi:MAG: RDD family protein, partial [Opitutae bacterium]
PGPSTEIHINRSGTQFGPYLLKELKDYLKAGNLRFIDLVWFEGVSEWVPLSKIPGVADGLNSLGSAAPPPPKPPPTPAAPVTPPLLQAISPAPSGLPVKAESSGETNEEEVEEVISTEKPSFETGNLASHGARAIAGLVDGLILFSVVGILIGIAGAATEFSGTLVFAGVVAYFLLGWLYYGLGESSQAGGFIGKRMSKIKVVRLSDDRVPGFGISSLRAMLKILLSLTIILPFIVFLTPRRQGLHDLACGTIVTEGEKEN